MLRASMLQFVIIAGSLADHEIVASLQRRASLARLPPCTREEQMRALRFPATLCAATHVAAHCDD